MENKNNDYIGTYDSMEMTYEKDILFQEDEGNDFIQSCNLEEGLLLGDYREDAISGLILDVEAGNITSASTTLDYINLVRGTNGDEDVKVIKDFRVLVYRFKTGRAGGNDFKLELRYNTELGVYSLKSVIYNGSFMTKDIVTTLDSELNIKAVL